MLNNITDYLGTNINAGKVQFNSTVNPDEEYSNYYG
jgi:hypothetical protein